MPAGDLDEGLQQPLEQRPPAEVADDAVVLKVGLPGSGIPSHFSLKKPPPSAP